MPLSIPIVMDKKVAHMVVAKLPLVEKLGKPPTLTLLPSHEFMQMIALLFPVLSVVTTALQGHLCYVKGEGKLAAHCHLVRRLQEGGRGLVVSAVMGESCGHYRHHGRAHQHLLLPAYDGQPGPDRPHHLHGENSTLDSLTCSALQGTVG